MLHYLRNGRIVQTVIRDKDGKPLFLEILDTRTNARRIIYGPWWDGVDNSRTDGYAVSEQDLPLIFEWFMEDEQSYWKRPRPTARNLIILPGAFPYCVPKVGDKLRDQNGKLYAVTHVPKGTSGLPWNGCVMLDKDVPDLAFLRWDGTETRTRCLIDFHADSGKPSSPVPGEDLPSADVGTAYRNVMRPTVTYFLRLQEPGTLGPKPFDRSKEWKPRLRKEFNDPERPQIVIRVVGHWFDNLFRFRCLHPRADVAGGLARWLKDFARNNGPSLESNGINRLFMWEHREASRQELSGDHVAAHDVTFYVRTEELRLEEVGTISKVNLNLVIATGLENSTAVFRPPDAAGWPNPYTGQYDESGNYHWGEIDIADNRTTGSM